MPITPYEQYPQARLEPLDYRFLADIIKYQKERQDKASSLVADAGKNLILQGGRMTQARAQTYNQQVLMPKIQDLQQKILNQQITPGVAYNEVLNFTNTVKADPEWQDIYGDQKYTETGDPDKKAAAIGANKHVFQNFYDTEAKKFRQTAPGERFDPQSFYGAILPPDRKEFEPFFKDFKGYIETRYADDSTKQTEYDAQGNPHVYLIRNGEKVSELTKDMIKEWAFNNYQTDDNFKNLFTYYDAFRNRDVVKPAVEALGNQTSPEEIQKSFGFTPAHAAEITANMFSGYYKYKEETAPKVQEIKTGKTKGDGTAISDEELITPLAQKMKEVNEKDESDIDAPMASALLNATYKKDTNTMEVDLTNTDKKPMLYISPAQTTNPNETSAERNDLGNKIAVMGAYNTLIKEAEEKAKKDPKVVKLEPVSYVPPDPQVSAGFQSAEQLQRNKIMTDAYNKAVSEKAQELLQKNSTFASLQKQAQQLKIDLSNPSSIEKEIFDRANIKKEDLELVSKISVMLNKKSGKFPFTSNKMVKTDSGEFGITSSVTLETYQIKHLLDDDDGKVSRAEELGFIYKRPEANKDGSTRDVYDVPVLFSLPKNLDFNSATILSNQRMDWGTAKEQHDYGAAHQRNTQKAIYTINENTAIRGAGKEKYNELSKGKDVFSPVLQLIPKLKTEEDRQQAKDAWERVISEYRKAFEAKNYPQMYDILGALRVLEEDVKAAIKE